MKRINVAKLALSILAIASTSGHAAEPDKGVGPYAGVAVGRSSFSTKGLSLAKVSHDETGVAAKLYGGYRFTENFGLEGGYVHLGSLSETVTVGAGTVEQSGKARSLYSAVTGRMPVGESLALTGKAGVSFGKVSGTNVLSASDNLLGSKRSLLVGVGAEYRMTPNLAFTVDYERFGKLSDKVSANMLSAGAHYTF